MIAYIIRRLLISVPTFLALTALVFSLIQLAPGTPLDYYLAANPELGYVDPERIEVLKQQMGLDKPAYVQYFIWLGGLLRGDFGESLATGRSIADELKSRIGNTVLLFAFSHAIGWTIAIFVGILSAAFPDSLLDHVVRSFALAGIALPAFWIGVMLIYVFSVEFGLFPVGGSFDPYAECETIFGYIGMRLHYLILPSITIAIRSVASVMRVTRAETLEVLSKQYVTSARAKGLKEWTVYTRHVLRNALLPVVTLMGVSVGTIFGGAVLTETVFAWPGLGRYLVQSVHVRDYPAVMAVAVLLCAMVLVVNLLVDLAYGFIDPRVKYEG